MSLRYTLYIQNQSSKRVTMQPFTFVVKGDLIEIHIVNCLALNIHCLLF